MRILITSAILVVSWPAVASPDQEPKATPPSDGYVYRVDLRHFSRVFEEGFPPSGVSTDILAAARGVVCYLSPARPGVFDGTRFVMFSDHHEDMQLFASTLSTPTTAAYLYRVRPTQAMYNLRHSVRHMQQRNPVSFQAFGTTVYSEHWIADGGITPEDVVSVEVFLDRMPMPGFSNSNYQPRNSNPNLAPYSPATPAPATVDSENVLLDARAFREQQQFVPSCLANVDYACHNPGKMFSVASPLAAAVSEQCPAYQMDMGEMNIRYLNARSLLPVLFASPFGVEDEHKKDEI